MSAIVLYCANVKITTYDMKLDNIGKAILRSASIHASKRKVCSVCGYIAKGDDYLVKYAAHQNNMSHRDGVKNVKSR